MKKFTKLWQLVLVLLIIPFTMNAQITIGTGPKLVAATYDWVSEYSSGSGVGVTVE